MKHKAVISFAGLSLAGVIVVLGLVMLSRRAGPLPAATIASQPLASVDSPAIEGEMRMHRIVQQGDLTTLVLSLRGYCGSSLQPFTEPQKQFVSVELVIGNQTAQALPLTLGNVELVTESDKAYPLLQNECPPAFSLNEIPANGLVRGQLAFRIPAGESPKLIRYTLGERALISGLRY